MESSSEPSLLVVPPSGPVRAHAIRLHPQQPLMDSLRNAADVILARIPPEECSAVFIMTAVGSLRAATLRLANASKKDMKDAHGAKPPDSVVGGQGAMGGEVVGKNGGNDIRRWERRFEIVSLVGTFSRDGGCHLHMSLSDADGRTVGGHLIDGVVFTTVEVVMGTANGIEFRRSHDEKTGYKELVPWQLPENRDDWRRHFRPNIQIVLSVVLGISIGVALSSSKRKL